MGLRTLWIAAGVLALAGGAAVYHYQSDKGTPAGQIAQAATPAAEKVVAVEAERVTVDTVLDDIRAVGTLGPDEAVVLATQIAGRRTEERRVGEGGVSPSRSRGWPQH